MTQFSMPKRPDVDAGIAAIYADKIAHNLTAHEAHVLEVIAREREFGLAACRAGRITDGESVIARARSILERATLSREAFVVSDSFLCAAEGFVHFRSGRTDAAGLSMYTAIDRCRELRDTFDYPAEGRRIHLACNAARVDVQAGQHDRASTTIVQLLNLIFTSDRRFWPYPDLEYASGPDRLDNGARWELMDQALAVVGTLDRDALSRVADAFPALPAGQPQPRVDQAVRFLTAVRAHSSNDLKVFLACCTEFFPSGGQYLPRASRHLADLLVTTARNR
jgi:hypothetical protein